MVYLGWNVASKVPFGFFFDVRCRLHKTKQCLELKMPFLASTKCLLLSLDFLQCPVEACESASTFQVAWPLEL